MDESQNNYADWKKPYKKRVFIAWFYLHKSLESANQAIVAGSSSELPRERGGRREGRRGDKGQEKNFGVMDTYTDLTVVIVSWVYKRVKTYQIVRLKYVQFAVYQLYLDKTSFFKCYSFQPRKANHLKQWLWDTGQDKRHHRRVILREKKLRQCAQWLLQVTVWKVSRPHHRLRKPKQSSRSLWGEKAGSAVQRGQVAGIDIRQ